MTSLAWLIPAALALGVLALAGFFWALRNGQFEDLEGAGWRVLDEDLQPGPRAAQGGTFAARHVATKPDGPDNA